MATNPPPPAPPTPVRSRRFSLNRRLCAENGLWIPAISAQVRRRSGIDSVRTRRDCPVMTAAHLRARATRVFVSAATAMFVISCGDETPTGVGQGRDQGPRPDLGFDSGVDTPDSGQQPGPDGGDAGDTGVARPDVGRRDSGLRPDGGLDPNRVDNHLRDSDCDGLSDAYEFATIYPGGAKTDPNNPDTRQCPHIHQTHSDDSHKRHSRGHKKIATHQNFPPIAAAQPSQLRPTAPLRTNRFRHNPEPADPHGGQNNNRNKPATQYEPKSQPPPPGPNKRVMRTQPHR